MKQEIVFIEKCPICDGQNTGHFKSIKDFSTSQEVFELSKCSDCGFVFTNPIPNQDAIARYYDSAEYISHTNTKRGLFARAYQLARNYAIKNKIKLLKRFITKGAVLVDYGSGTGEFLNACSKAGFATTGIELSDKARSAAVLAFGLPVLKPSDFNQIPDNSVDVITMWHVLEHLPNLKSSLKTILLKIKKEGLLVLALPNRDSYDAKVYGEYWAAWDVPIHFYHFTKNDIDNLAKINNLEVVETRNMPLDSIYVSLLSEKYKTGKKNWPSALFTGLVSNVKGMKDKNMSSLTYVLRKL